MCALTLIFSGSPCWTQAGGLTVITSSILGLRGNSCRFSGRRVDLEVARSLCREGRGEEGRGQEGQERSGGEEDGGLTLSFLMMKTVVFFPSSPVTIGTSKKSLFIQLSRVDTMSSVDVNRSLSLGGGRGGGREREGRGREGEELKPIRSDCIVNFIHKSHIHTVVYKMEGEMAVWLHDTAF